MKALGPDTHVIAVCQPAPLALAATAQLAAENPKAQPRTLTLIGGPVDARGGVVTDFTLGTFHGLEVTNCEVRDVAYRGIYAAAGGSGHKLSSNTVKTMVGG